MYSILEVIVFGCASLFFVSGIERVCAMILHVGLSLLIYRAAKSNKCFKGPVKNHAVEIGYGIQPEQEGHGYTTEALQAMTQWAFSQKDVVFVEAETAPDNKASQRVLEKCGFVPDGTTGEEGPRFVLESPLTNWSPIYMLFGMSIGMAIGHFQDQMLWGMAIGMSLGVLVGILLNNSAKKGREALRQQRHPHA